MEQSLCILITNNSLAKRGGTELYVYDLAIALKQMRQQPIVYSPQLGEVSQKLIQAGISVVSDLKGLNHRPDIIHGHHHPETMNALQHFLGVPAVYVCHSPILWIESALKFPRILRYIAVDDTCKQRLCKEGIAEKEITLLPSFVDVSRFKPRASLPRVPKVALVFSNFIDKPLLRVIQKACRRACLKLIVMGEMMGQSCAKPEQHLAEFDIVFAKGRAALEALAVGAAVISCDGFGKMVTLANLDYQYRENFGIATFRESFAVDGIVQEIQRYDAKDTEMASRKIRRLADSRRAIRKLFLLYEHIIEQHRQGYTENIHAERLATTSYLNELEIERRRIEADLLTLRQDILTLRQTRMMRLKELIKRLPLISDLFHLLLRILFR